MQMSFLKEIVVLFHSAETCMYSQSVRTLQRCAFRRKQCCHVHTQVPDLVLCQTWYLQLWQGAGQLIGITLLPNVPDIFFLRVRKLTASFDVHMGSSSSAGSANAACLVLATRQVSDQLRSARSMAVAKFELPPQPHTLPCAL